MWNLQLSGADAFLAMLVLLPGVISALIRDALVETETRSVQRTFVNAAIFDVMIYVCLLVFSPLGLTPYPSSKPFNIVTVAVAFILAVALGVVAGAASSQGIWQRILFKLGLTKKGPKNTWVDDFQQAEEAEAWAYVYLRDGRRVFGVPKYCSSNGDRTSVFLARGAEGNEPVLIYDKDGRNPIPQNGPGVLITPAAGITLIAFLDGQTVG